MVWAFKTSQLHINTYSFSYSIKTCSLYYYSYTLLTSCSIWVSLCTISWRCDKFNLWRSWIFCWSSAVSDRLGEVWLSSPSTICIHIIIQCRIRLWCMQSLQSIQFMYVYICNWVLSTYVLPLGLSAFTCSRSICISELCCCSKLWA